MKPAKLFIPTSESALPEFMRTGSIDLDPSETWNQTVSLHGLTYFG